MLQKQKQELCLEPGLKPHMVPQETIIDEGSLTDEENDSDYIPIKQGVQIRISTSSIESGSFTQNSASNDLDPSVHDQRIHDKSNN